VANHAVLPDDRRELSGVEVESSGPGGCDPAEALSRGPGRQVLLDQRVGGVESSGLRLGRTDPELRTDRGEGAARSRLLYGPPGIGRTTYHKKRDSD